MKNFYLLIISIFIMLSGCAQQIETSMNVAQDIAVIADLRSLHTVEISFMARTGKFGTLDELKKADLLPGSFAEKKKNGFLITQGSVEPTSFVFRAKPAPDNNFCTRHFYVDQTGVIRAHEGGPAGPNDPVAKLLFLKYQNK